MGSAKELYRTLGKRDKTWAYSGTVSAGCEPALALPENPAPLVIAHRGAITHLSSPENDTWAWLTWA